jgi:catechol 2,3-dioxygenase-like lactoylglutathione lyase family enzyme
VHYNGRLSGTICESTFLDWPSVYLARMYSLNHIALLVKDLDRSAAFYEGAFAMWKVWRGTDKLYLTTGSDILGLQLSSARRIADTVSDIDPNEPSTPIFEHFGLVTTDREKFMATLERVRQLTRVSPLKRSRDGSESVYFEDPDGYPVQLTFVEPDYFLPKPRNLQVESESV